MDKKVPLWIFALSVAVLSSVISATTVLNYQNQHRNTADQKEARQDCAEKQGEDYNKCVRSKGFNPNF